MITCGYCYTEDNKQVEMDLEDDELVELDILLGITPLGITPIKLPSNAGKMFDSHKQNKLGSLQRMVTSTNSSPFVSNRQLTSINSIQLRSS